MADPHLLIPIKLQALVISDKVIEKQSALKVDGDRYVANDGRWSPLAQDYRKVLTSVGPPGPRPFYGAGRNYPEKGRNYPADQLVLPPKSPALATKEHRGVYLHWVLPSGLRHAYTSGSLEFPALPDQWLVVRFCRQGPELKTKAWFIDSGLVVNSSAPPNLLFARAGKYEARRVGQTVSLDLLGSTNLEGERTTITAIGNAQTSSPTFTAFVAENRNVLSWRDDLNDLRVPVNEGKVPKETVLSYLLLGWYHDAKNEPLTVIQRQLTAIQRQLKGDAAKEPSTEDVLEAIGWIFKSATDLPADLLTRPCVFHGMVGHINYWDSATYKGPMLGYPGSPSVEDVLDEASPSFKVGVGNNAEDALVSLVSSEYSGAQEAPNLWKALEAVIYRQPESLVRSWNAAPRDHAVHQNWFSMLEAGKVWSIRPRPGNESPTAGDKPTPKPAPKPTREQLTSLKKLNDAQAAADDAGRELAALQQDLYARWWKLSEKSHNEGIATLDVEESDCRALAKRVATLRGKVTSLLQVLEPLPKQIEGTLPAELELFADAAPRFWMPADPVIVVKNCGLPTKHQFPRPLPCRLSDQVVTAAETVVSNERKSFDAPAGVADIAAAVKKHFSERSEILTSLLNEGSLVEQAITDLAARTLPAQKQFFAADSWREWTERLVKDMTSDGSSDSLPTDSIVIKLDSRNERPQFLAELWVQQPWSPLFLDWQITWFPTANSGTDFGPVWPLAEHDYQPGDIKALAPLLTKDGFTVRGRSLLSTFDDRMFKAPIETLRDLLHGSKKDKNNPAFPDAVVDILSNYEVVWEKTLCELAGAGLMGQSLSGFHQALLRRDVTLPGVVPDATRPWIAKESLKPLEGEVSPLLEKPRDCLLTAGRLAPPTYSGSSSAMPFAMTRAGALRIDELWLVDDFGQSADLLGPTPDRGTSSGQVFHPRMRWHDNAKVVAMPPRVVQPARLNFRFTSAEDSSVESNCDPALTPICGWIFYNPLDQSLVLCHSNGSLAGELIISKDGDRFRINWHSAADGVVLDKIRNATLKAFARALVEPGPTSTPRLLDLLKLIDRALERIRPAAARRDAALFGRPLALVSASLGLELFGKAWTDPVQKAPATRPDKTGNATLDSLQLRVNLGCSHNTEDGLIGYYTDGNYNRIVPAQLPEQLKDGRQDAYAPREASVYIGHQENDAVRVGFGSAKPLTLLMDPWGSVQAAVGIVPAKTITLAQAELDQTLEQLEASFRVGPVLIQAGRLSLPTPAGDKGRWNFRGPLTGDTAATLLPSDPKYFSDQPVVATEGRLLLLTTQE